MTTPPDDLDFADVAARYWQRYAGPGDFEAFTAGDDLLAAEPTTASIPLLLALLEGSTDDAHLSYFAAGPLNDVIHMEDDRIDQSLHAAVVENARLRRAMSRTQIDRGELSRRFGTCIS